MKKLKGRYLPALKFIFLIPSPHLLPQKEREGKG